MHAAHHASMKMKMNQIAPMRTSIASISIQTVLILLQANGNANRITWQEIAAKAVEQLKRMVMIELMERLAVLTRTLNAEVLF
jgi:hypothetical protein